MREENTDNSQASPAITRWGNLENAIYSLAGLSNPEQTYLTCLLTYGRELEQCCRGRAADMLFNKVERMVREKASQPPGRAKRPVLGFEKVTQSFKQREYQELMSFFQEHKSLFPASEKAFFEKELASLDDEPSIHEKRKKTRGSYAVTGYLQKRTGSLMKQLRNQIYENVYRYKTAPTRRDGITDAWDALPQQAGFYNSLYNLNSVLKFIGDADPLWVEDFKAHYREVQYLEAMFTYS